MLDIRAIRQDADALNQALKRRDASLSVDAIVALDDKRRQLLQEEETLRSSRNELSKLIGDRRKAGETSGPELDALQAETKTMAERIKELDHAKKALEDQQNDLLLTLPNAPSANAPDGPDDSHNVEVRRWGNEFLDRPTKNADGEWFAHWDLGPNLGILDFERGVKVAQSRFTLQRGMGAKLTRALIGFMLDTHSENHGYEEVSPPFLVNRQAMLGTSQLPKFEEDLFKCKDDELYLIPTAEVPVTNLYAGEVIAEEELPLKFVAYTPCFRREAGSAGRDTRGLIRQHQFDKVELVKLVLPEHAEAEHQKLVSHAEKILQLLELPYRVMDLCTGDMGFAAQRCYDLEVWLPGQQAYREISSCSHFGDFQARRIGLKYRPADGGKLAYLHTINGSGPAVGRTLVAILENYQLGPDRVAIPNALQPYLRGVTEISATPASTEPAACHVG